MTTAVETANDRPGLFRDSFPEVPDFRRPPGIFPPTSRAILGFSPHFSAEEALAIHLLYLGQAKRRE
jgi:hypothetical protein